MEPEKEFLVTTASIAVLGRMKDKDENRTWQKGYKDQRWADNCMVKDGFPVARRKTNSHSGLDCVLL